MKAKPVKKHIKMYASDKLIEEVKEVAEKRGISQSTLMLIAVRMALTSDKLDKILGAEL